MVKVLPTQFTLFESQNIINPSAEPLCISCSDDNVFIACDGCVLEVYTLSTRQQIAKIRTIWPASAVAYNKHGDCIVTVESRSIDSSATSRVYFKWRGIGDFNRPQKVVLMGSGSHQDPVDAEIVELPVENCSCISVCELTGVIAVGSEKKIRLFSLIKESTISLSTGGYKLSSILDIRTDMRLRSINICGNYIACISTHRIRVLKFLVIGSNNHPWSGLQSNAEDSAPLSKKSSTKTSQCKKDEHFLLWSPSYIWEAETKIPGKTSIEEESPVISTPSNTSSPASSADMATGKQSSLWSSPFRSPLQAAAPKLSTITLPAITHAITEARRDSGKHELEVLGPVEYVWGQPLIVETQEELGPYVKCRALTMLYRRFASTGYAYVHVSSNESSYQRPQQSIYDAGKQRSATLGGRSTSSSSSSSGPSKFRGGIHTVQLVPTMTVTGNGSKELIGMTCALANRTKGFMYDIFDKTKLISSISFMTRSQTVCFDGSFFHALSGDTVDSYTSRIIPSVIARKNISPNGEHMGWISQPCPSPSMELTLISSNKFIGCHDLTSSPTHNVVLCKLNDSSPPMQPAASASFLESLSIRRLRKPATRGTWNIYVLEKKPVITMFKQFIEFAKTLEDLSPPMMIHHLSEAHVLLRSLAVSMANPSMEVTDHLKSNCFNIAHSLTRLSSKDRTVPATAAGYYLLSGKPIRDVFEHIISQQQDIGTASSQPFVVLVAYLNMVLFQFIYSSQIDSLLPLADQILELYTKYDCDRLPDFVLFSWLKGYSKEKAITLLQMLLPNVKSHNTNIINLALCSLLCELNQMSEAVGVLEGVSEDYLSTWIKDNYDFMVDAKTEKLTRMGTTVMRKNEGIFLSLLSDSLQEGQLEWATLCEVLNVNEEMSVVENQLLKKLLESIVLGKVAVKPTVAYLATEMLTTLLIKRIVSTDDNCTNSSNVQFGARHAWLQKLPPFQNSVTNKGDSILYTVTPQSCLKDLMELQSLMCSSHMSHDLASHIDRMISNVHTNEGNDAIMTSLRLLTWPFLGKISKAVAEIVIPLFPLITVDYCNVYFKKNIPEWKTLLDELLHQLDATQQNNTIKSVYQDTLKHVASLTTTEELLALLPPNGNIMFYLPIIEYSCKLCLSGNISNTIHKVLSDTHEPHKIQ